MTTVAVINIHTGNKQLGTYVIVQPPFPVTAVQGNAAIGHNLHLFLTDWLLKYVCEQSLSPMHLSSAISCHTHGEIHRSTNKQHILLLGLPNQAGLCPPVIIDLFLAAIATWN